MDKTTKPNIQTFNLESALNSYKILSSLLTILIFLIILLYIRNPNGFNKLFGYEVFITGPILLIISILIRQIILFQKSPEESWLSLMPFQDRSWFLIAIILFIVLLSLGAFFSMLAVAGIFSKNPPENNSAVIINFVIIALFLIISAIIYFNSKQKDDKILNTLPKTYGDIYTLRTKYTLLFIAFIILTTLLYFYNPYGIMSNYGGASIFFLLFVGIIFVAMITIYQYYLANPSKIAFFKEAPTFGSFLKGLYIIFALILSGLLIYGSLSVMGVFNQDASKPESIGHIIFNLFLFCTMLGIIYKLANAGGFLDKNPLFRLIINTLLYIPCLLVNIFGFIGKLLGLTKSPGTAPPTKTEFIILIISLILIFGYYGITWFVGPWIRNKYYTQGGRQLINQPIPTNTLTNITSYQKLNNSDKFTYQYAMSFWFFIDALPPSTNASYLKVVPILSYGENPCIKYSAENNSIYITVKQKSTDSSSVENIQKREKDITSDNINKWKDIQKDITETIEKVKNMAIGEELDNEGHRIIYKNSDVLLQKWNQIVINYDGGTMDIFYNGKLVKSAIEVVPYIKYDMLSVGSNNGIIGSVANLMYFNAPLDYLTINKLYSSLKDKNPPSIPYNTKKIIPI
jgi:hypothetical protein